MGFGAGSEALLHWLRNQGLEILILGLGVVLLHRAIRKIARIWQDQIDSSTEGRDDVARSEAAKHQHALIQVAEYIVIGLIYALAITKILDRLGFPLASLVAPATVIGAALGFGAQRIVQDFLAGFFIITERQYGYGDTVDIMAAGAGESAGGTVEDVTLRVTKIRTLNGEVVTIPNGQIVKATNQSREWARSIIDVPVPNSTDLNHVTDVLHSICVDVVDDERVGNYILDEPTVMGVESITLDQTTLRLLVRTMPGKQWEVGRRMRALITRRFRDEGIVLEPEALAAIRAGMFRGPSHAANAEQNV